MPIRRGIGGLSRAGTLFDRPGYFDEAIIAELTLNSDLILKASDETYGIVLAHGDTSSASQNYTATIPALSADGDVVVTNATQTLTNKTITGLLMSEIADTNGNEIFKFTATSNAVNELTVANAATGGDPTITASGSDSNIDITLSPKGSGVVNITGNINVTGTSTTVN